MTRWLWGLAIGLAVVAAAAAAFVTLGRGEKERALPRIQVHEPSPEEEELARIRIAASEGTLEEATRTERGWVVRVEQKSPGVQPSALFGQATKFFQGLDRNRIEVAETSFVAVTSGLKDVWGNTLEDLPVLRVGLSRETFERINWDGFEPRNLMRVADELWLHDAVLQELAKEEMQQNQQGGGQGPGRGSGQSSGQGGGPGGTQSAGSDGT